MNNALFLETEGACRVSPADRALSFKYIGIYIYFKMHSSKYILTPFKFQLLEKKTLKSFFLEPELQGDEISLQTLLAYSNYTTLNGLCLPQIQYRYNKVI